MLDLITGYFHVPISKNGSVECSGVHISSKYDIKPIAIPNAIPTANIPARAQ